MQSKIFLSLLLFYSSYGFSEDSLQPLPPGFKIGGLSASELSIKWWKWAMSSSDDSNPVRDLTGKNCATQQSGNVWFLAGGFGSSKIKRSCVMPSGKIIFFPIINMLYYQKFGEEAYSCAEAKEDAALNNDTAIDLYAEINGVAVAEPKRYRAATQKCFNVFENRPNSYNAYPSASDGYWIAVGPFKKGKYNIKFGGRYNNSTTDYGRGIQDIEYELIVK